MATLTYVKGLPTPVDELNSLGFTQFEMFLAEYSSIFHKAVCETVNHLLVEKDFNKSSWNTGLQKTYGINKRHANGVIAYASCAVDAAKEKRKQNINTLLCKLKSVESWISKAQKKLEDALKFYAKKNWQKSKTGCRFPLSCSVENRETNWHNLRFQIHNKKRRAYKLTTQIKHLKQDSIYVNIPKHQVYIVGSKDETLGNQACQWDGDVLKFRVPACLEPKFGKYVQTKLGSFDRNINRLPNEGAKTWHFYRKHGKWNAAVQFTPSPVTRVSRHSAYGCIGIDMNPGSIGWAYVDQAGNLKTHGQIPLQMGLPSGKQKAQVVDACLQLAILANTFACPVVCEYLDFSVKKEVLRERGRKYARMLSGWAYSQFFKTLTSILSNRGINLITVNPAYTSVIGLVKFARIYGLASDEAAAIAVARRGMQLSERLPSAITAYLSVNDSKHVWHWWNKLNNLLKKSGISRRHDYYAISNWESQVNRLRMEAPNSA